MNQKYEQLKIELHEVPIIKRPGKKALKDTKVSHDPEIVSEYRLNRIVKALDELKAAVEEFKWHEVQQKYRK